MKIHFKRCFALCVNAVVALCSYGITLDECQQLAQDNYPLIKTYSLIEQTRDFTLSNLSKEYLPKIQLSAQFSYQNEVAQFPDALSRMMTSAGNIDMKGLKKDQYKVGVDVTQTVWDGGMTTHRKDVTQANTEVERHQLDVEMYGLRSRVNDVYFGILLIDKKLKLNSDKQALLRSSIGQLEYMLNGGIASPSDVDVVKAELLNANQQSIDLEAARQSFVQVLAIFTGKEVSEIVDLEMPHDAMSVSRDVDNRPEIALFNSQLNSIGSREQLLSVDAMPKISLFAQGFYGYPGFDMFHDMMSHKMSLNGIIGARVTWNIGSLYSMSNDYRKLSIERNRVDVSRKVFEFNNRMLTSQQSIEIERYGQLLKDDDQIIALRHSVRVAAEKKLERGVIDTNNLLQEVNRENAAYISKAIHETEMAKCIQELKITTNK